MFLSCKIALLGLALHPQDVSIGHDRGTHASCAHVPTLIVGISRLVYVRYLCRRDALETISTNAFYISDR